MVVSIQEAETKICAPLGRLPDSHLRRCCGADCMAWRPVGDGERGYCGMAGVPLALNMKAVVDTVADKALLKALAKAAS